MDQKSAQWSPSEAFRIFRATWRGDKGEFAALRKSLLKNPAIHEERYEIKGRVITALCAGPENARPAIFLHGSPGNAQEWRKLLEEKQSRYRIIALDRPGYGPTEQAEPDLAHDALLLTELLKKLAAQNNAILVGHSLGGGVAADLAARYPSLVKGLVFVGASLDPTLEQAQGVQFLFDKTPLKNLLTRSIRHSNRELIEYAQTYLKAIKIDKITCPVAVVHSHDDPLVSFKNAAFIRENFVNAASVNIITIDSGGHFLAETRPEEIWKAIDLVASYE